MPNRPRLFALERRLAKIEKKRGASRAANDHPFNKMLVEHFGEPPRANVNEAFLRVLTLISERGARGRGDAPNDEGAEPTSL
jgi:hypothetical protein